MRGLAVPSVDAFATPLGDVPIDDAGRAAPARTRAGRHLRRAARRRALARSAAAVPAGRARRLRPAADRRRPVAAPDQVARVLDAVVGRAGHADRGQLRPEPLPHLGARRGSSTTQTTRAIVERRSDLPDEQACGACGINGLMQVARRRGLPVELLDQRNSGDTAGDRSRVVGYGSYAALSRLEPARALRLLRTAADAIEAQLGLRRGRAARRRASCRRALAQPRASFVTLTIEGELRGCCGTLEPARPLLLDVWRNAQASAFRDPRFPPLTAREWRRSSLEVSVLTPCERIVVAHGAAAAARARARPRRPGARVARQCARRSCRRSGSSSRTPQDFLRHLKHKAGWAAEFWAADVRGLALRDRDHGRRRPGRPGLGCPHRLSESAARGPARKRIADSG